ncbi:proline dehydrogenase family protein [candidate division KSB1 bacterium]
MFNTIARRMILSVTGNPTVRRIVTRYGMASPDGFARRFVAGETLDEAIEEVKKLNDIGICASLDYLGESVNTVEETHIARDQILTILDMIEKTGVNSNVSVKLTQLGLDLGDDLCIENLKSIVMRAKKYGNWIRVDMESSDYTQRTIDVFNHVVERFGNAVGIVLQSYLYRTEYDVRSMNKAGAKVRLCKGAYFEPEIVAFRKKRMVDLSFVRCFELLLTGGVDPAIATHDEALIQKTKDFAKQHAIEKDTFEFQMLFGIRRDLQKQLVNEGYRLRVYVPFGTEWFPYFSRRLGERIGNVMFIVKSLYYDSQSDTSG